MEPTPLTDALMDRAAPAVAADRPPLLEARDISKYFGAVVAIEGVSLTVRAGQVTCLLGDNGAGKSTLIKTLSGVYQPDKGTLAVDGDPVNFSSPRDALDAGIATVYQDLSVMPLMNSRSSRSMSRAGSTLPSGCGLAGSSNARTTWSNASESRSRARWSAGSSSVPI